MKAANWTIPAILAASALFYAGACFFLGSILLASPLGIILSVVWWVAVVASCASIAVLDLRR